MTASSRLPTNTQHLSFIQWNAQSMRAHGPNFYNAIFTRKKFKNIPDIIFIQETWFQDYNIFPIPNFNVITKNRGSTGRGGLAIYLKNNITYKIVETPEEEEYQKVNIFLQNFNITLINYYNPCQKINIFKLNKILENCQDNIIISGDFNSHNPIWGSNKMDINGETIQKFLDSSNLTLINDGSPTRLDPKSGAESHIDLTLSSSTCASRIQWQVLPELFGSDHYVIYFEFFINQNIQHFNLRNLSPESFWSVKNVNWELYSEYIRSEIKESYENDENDINVQNKYDFLVDCITRTADKLLLKTTNQYKHKNPIPWWNEDCNQAIKERNKSYNRLRKTLDNQDLIEYKKKKAMAQKTIRNAKRKYWEKHCSSLNRTSNLGEVWKHVKNLRQRGSNQENFSNLIDPVNNKSITNVKEKADHIANYFQSIDKKIPPQETRRRRLFEKLVVDKIIHMEHKSHEVTLKAMDEHFTEHELHKAINEMKETAPGKDGIKPVMIKHLPNLAKCLLLDIYNLIWDSSHFPKQWYDTIQIPILKQNKDPTQSSSYRPISLTPVLLKIMERMIKNRFTYYLEKNNIINSYQSGFRKNRSTMDHLLRLETEAHNSIKNNHYTGAVFMDLEKAYDLLWRKGLIYKLYKLGITGKFLKWTISFLKDRYCTVRIENQYSSNYLLQNGIPQGSCISPTLFCIMVNDINLHDDNVKLSMFADDIAFWYSSSNIKYVQVRLQRAVDNFVKWCSQWGMTISPSKSSVMVFTNRTNNGIELKLKDSLVKQCKEVKFLGIWLDDKLSWRKHISSIIIKCNKRINLLRCMSGTSWGRNSTCLSLVYKGLIRSILDYGCQLYDSAALTLKNQLDSIQYKSLRIITGVFMQPSLEALQVECGELPLQLRRKYFLQKYYIYLNICKDNHPSKEIINTEFIETDKWETGEGPFVNRVEVISYENIEKFENCCPKYPFWHYPKPKVSWNIHERLSKKYDSHFDLKDYSLETIYTRYPDHLKVFTDGSKHFNDGTGAAFYIPEFNIRKYYRLSPISILRAELTAIVLALEWLEQIINTNVVILSDSLSALQSVVSYDNEHSLVQEILYKLNILLSKNVQIEFEWIPSHVGIRGNEVVDSLANKATKKHVIDVYIPSSRKELENEIKKQSLIQWQCRWNSSLKGRYLYSIQKNVRDTFPTKTFTRGEEKIIHQFRLGKCNLNYYLYLIKRHENGLCPECNENETIDHFLFTCKKYETLRRPILQKLKRPYDVKDLFSNDNNIRMFLLFVRRSNRFSYI